MGGSPCKAWDWRNPIVQTLFTQGATRTASVAHKRAGLSFGLSPRQRGCAARARWPWARAFPALDGDIPKAGFRSRGAGRGRRIMPRPGRSASAPRGGGKTAQAGQKRQRPEGGGKTAQAGQKRQRPAGGGRRAGGARPTGASGPGHVRPFGPNAAPPRRGRQNRPGRAEAPTPRGGAAGGRSPPGGGLWPRPCSALRAERRPPPPGAAKPPRPGRSANVPRGDAGLQGFELSALLGILYPVA